MPNNSQQIHVRIDETPKRGSSSLGVHQSTFFEPQREQFTPKPPSCRRTGDTAGAPEKKLTLFALRLAVLEKAASSLGTLAFIWATVILLSGYSTTLVSTDFWFVTIILLSESTRIFSRSHELEWQHQATCSLAETGRRSFSALKSKSHFILRVLRVCLRPSLIARLESNDGRQLSDDRNSEKVREYQKQIAQSLMLRTWWYRE